MSTRSSICRSISAPRRQRGASLLVALMFLIVLTMLGVTAAQNSSMEERMAGNTRNRDMALQSAEAALTYVQNNLGTGDNIRGMTYPSTGLRVYDGTIANDATYWRGYNWSSASLTANISLAQVAEQPKYVVDKLPTVAGTEYYRVTTRGVGKEANAVVVLQAMYRYVP